MKYTTEIVIDKPREEVIKKMDSLENLKHWQRGLIKAEPISGEFGKEGSKMLLKYKMGKRELEMVETILTNELPAKLYAEYTTKGVENIQKNYFNKIDENHTQWVSESEFNFSGFTMKIMGFLMPGAFKKQSLKYMRDFKAFAEKGVSVTKETTTAP